MSRRLDLVSAPRLPKCDRKMELSQLFGSLIATSEDFAPIIRQLRSKCGLPELKPGDDPNSEIYLDDWA